MRTPGPDNQIDDDRSDRRSRPRTDPARTAHHDAVYTLARASELHDSDTGQHVLRIRSIVEQLALQLNFDADDAEALGYDAMLHDVGKLRLPAALLQKADALTSAERGRIESHTVLGEELLSERPSMLRAASIARSHHERYDGQGYPDGRLGEEIPLAARITAVADVLDALLSARAYKEAWSFEQAFDAVCRLAGSQLDPEVVAALRRCHDAGTLREVWSAAPSTGPTEAA
ncbi:MAG: HD-GYP domain-containing protein [Planctomycetota bacterium]|jgi:putative two-component system response regulator